MSVSIESRIWIKKNGKSFLGPGRINLLEAIDKTGSISKAATLLNMSYKKAWGLLKSMDSQSEQALVIKETGGKNGGGTRLTDQGKIIIKKFRHLESINKQYLNNELDDCCIE